MRILHANKFFYRRGGAEQHMFDVMELFAQHGHENIPFAMQDEHNESTAYSRYFVSHVSLEDPKKLNIFKKISAVGRMLYSFEAQKNIRALLHDYGVDIIHLHNIYHHISPSILPEIKKKHIPVVMTIHDYKLLVPNYTFFHHGRIHEEDGRGWYLSCVGNKCMDDSRIYSGIVTAEMIFHHKIMRYYEQYVDLFIAPSEFVKEKFVSFGWNPDSIEVLPHFLGPSLSISQKIIQRPVEKQFAYVGRLSGEKGIGNLVSYWLEHHIPYTLHIYGEGPLRVDLEKMIAAEKGVRIILHGHMNRDSAYKDIQEHCTAVIVPTLTYETFGLVLIEAWAYGIPTISHGVGALLELTHASQAGQLFSWEKGNLESRLESIDSDNYRQRACIYMRDHHKPEDYYVKLLDLYKKVAKTSHA